MKKFIVILIGALVLVLLVLILRKNYVQTGILRGGETILAKTTPTVLVSKDPDGYGLEISVRDFKKVRKVEMLVSYVYRGRAKPPLLASGSPQQDSYWAHFRFESCSRGDCVYYKVEEAKFNLTLNYEDGENLDFSSSIPLASVSKETLIALITN